MITCLNLCENRVDAQPVNEDLLRASMESPAQRYYPQCNGNAFVLFRQNEVGNVTRWKQRRCVFSLTKSLQGAMFIVNNFYLDEDTHYKM